MRFTDLEKLRGYAIIDDPTIQFLKFQKTQIKNNNLKHLKTLGRIPSFELIFQSISRHFDVLLLRCYFFATSNRTPTYESVRFTYIVRGNVFRSKVSIIYWSFSRFGKSKIEACFPQAGCSVNLYFRLKYLVKPIANGDLKPQVHRPFLNWQSCQPSPRDGSTLQVCINL